MLAVDSHPALDLGVLEVVFPNALEQMPSNPALVAALSLTAEAPMASSDEVRLRVRDLLRHGGFKPTGRNKPASEYLIKADAAGYLATINAAVDICNVVSLHSGLPISVVDLDRVQQPLRVGLAEEGSRYVFNASGQEIDVGKLLCLHDSEGPCANAVKDTQRTKTDGESTRCLYLVWGTHTLPGRTGETTEWLASLCRDHGASVVVPAVTSAD